MCTINEKLNLRGEVGVLEKVIFKMQSQASLTLLSFFHFRFFTIHEKSFMQPNLYAFHTN